jgi:hypothetical protein
MLTARTHVTLLIVIAGGISCAREADVSSAAIGDSGDDRRPSIDTTNDVIVPPIEASTDSSAPSDSGVDAGTCKDRRKPGDGKVEDFTGCWSPPLHYCAFCSMDEVKACDPENTFCCWFSCCPPCAWTVCEGSSPPAACGTLPTSADPMRCGYMERNAGVCWDDLADGG